MLQKRRCFFTLTNYILKVFYQNKSQQQLKTTLILHINHKNFQVIIIGAGGAGLMAALSCIENGIKNVAVISKVFPTRSHTVAAKGGVNAALGNILPDDWKWHFYDTVKGGDYLVDYDAAEFMCKNAVESIIKLEKMGVIFSRNDSGKIDQRMYGGQKTNFGKGDLAYRACYSKDSTGQTIINTLYGQCLKQGVKFFNEFFITDLLITNHNQCSGAIAVDLDNGEVNIFQAKITILATGGYGQIYQNTTSANICTGDGNGLILKEGLQLQDLEFVQFHPTSLYGTGLLISEAARGEGGYLINGFGEKFMSKYAPNYKDLASRDVVARAIASEIYQGRGGGVNKDQVYLVISHLTEKTLKEKIPTVLELVNAFSQVNPLIEPIPIATAAHYTMGGIPTNLKCQVLNNNQEVVGLLAIGEAACASVHGANRLGCNSLLDIIVFGNLSGNIAKDLLAQDNYNTSNQATIKQIIDDKLEKIKAILSQKGDQSSLKIKAQMKQIVEKYIGVFRNQDLLQQGLNQLLALQSCLKFVAIKNQNLIWNDELVEFLQTENLMLQAIATAHCALNRKESRGAHFRQDFPNRDDKNWQKHSLISFNLSNNSFDFATKEIRLKTFNQEIGIITPEERKY